VCLQQQALELLSNPIPQWVGVGWAGRHIPRDPKLHLVSPATAGVPCEGLGRWSTFPRPSLVSLSAQALPSAGAENFML
jgi:hypothetical protein